MQEQMRLLGAKWFAPITANPKTSEGFSKRFQYLRRAAAGREAEAWDVQPCCESQYTALAQTLAAANPSLPKHDRPDRRWHDAAVRSRSRKPYPLCQCRAPSRRDILAESHPISCWRDHRRILLCCY